MKSIFKTAVIFAVLVVPAMAHADDDKVRADARCVIVGGRLASSSDINERTRANLMVVYYIGKLDGRYPKMDLESLVVNEASHVTSAELESEAQRCIQALVRKGQQITRLGNELKKLGGK